MRSKLPLLHSCPGGIRKSTFHGPWRTQSAAPRHRLQAEFRRAIGARSIAPRFAAQASSRTVNHHPFFRGLHFGYLSPFLGYFSKNITLPGNQPLTLGHPREINHLQPGTAPISALLSRDKTIRPPFPCHSMLSVRRSMLVFFMFHLPILPTVVGQIPSNLK
jgi:hypothetical protein